MQPILPPSSATSDEAVPKRDAFQRGLQRRQMVGSMWERFFQLSNLFALLVLFVLFASIINGVFGYVAWNYAVRPAELADRPLTELSEPELVTMLQDKVAANVMKVLMRDTLSQVAPNQFTSLPMREVLVNQVYDPALADKLIHDLTPAEIGKILSDNLTTDRLRAAIERQIIKPTIVRSWSLTESLFNYNAIVAEHDTKFPSADLKWHSWLSWDFITRPLATNATDAGLRTALIGSLWVLVITIGFSVPLGLGAAIYLQEYASEDNWLNTLIETNIRNLAGVPSIIYGMLGLFVFVRLLAPLTSGAIFGVQGMNGRTVLSGGLTLGLVILPVIIINAQEAIKAVAPSLREASYGLGATKWQTTSRIVIPQAAAGMLTGIILGVSRAVGETAPLIVVLGTVTFLSQDPNSPFSRTTVIPFQIYQWAFRPEQEFQSTASAAILTLLILLLLINSVAIYLRYRFTSKRI